ncbi:flagellar basal body rod protein FlgB [Phosphitispora sp. TUW77]|uniref:flagellar basal body rod protein FlgB n=1 Tax=Phosphitispora sp. TUW77 TaxID=3152361 RepID=UPI003AB350A9
MPNYGSCSLDFYFAGVKVLIEKMLITRTMNILEKGLDASSMRNTVIADNLANVDTPGFKKSEVYFEEELRKAIGRKNCLAGMLTHEKHIPIGRKSELDIAPKIDKSEDTSMRNDGNNVDVDREMAALAKNSIMYTALAQQLNSEFQKIRMAIKGQ